MSHSAVGDAAHPSTPTIGARAVPSSSSSSKRPLSPRSVSVEAATPNKRLHTTAAAADAHAGDTAAADTAPTTRATTSHPHTHPDLLRRASSTSSDPLSIDMSSAPISQSAPQLVLTPLEESIFQHVLACCAMFKTETQVRVAGGWVRDKLLGLESEDIDFALDRETGEEFALKLAEYLKSIGEKASSVGVIKVNPDQSKHLATATMKILDVSIDLNNFREEIYHPGSRIPEITLSTAKEDALRRDFTINSLYYNIHTRQVEDHVGGLADLRAGLLRTPRDPFKTFSDDPLRILRAARFAARFGYRVDDAITAAARTPSIQADLATKVSRERFGLEIGKMLHMYRTAYGAFELLIQQWGMRRIVFEAPPTVEPCPPTEIGEMKLIEIEKKGAAKDDERLTEVCLRGMANAHAKIQSQPTLYSQDEASSLLLASFLLPYHGYRTEIKKGRFQPLVWWIVRESLRLPQRDAQLASDLLLHAHNLVKASFLHREATYGGDASAAAAASTDASSSSSSSSSFSPFQRLTLVTGGLLRLTGAHSRVALDLAEVLLDTLNEQVPPPGTVASFDLSLGLKKPPPTVGPSELKQQLRAYIRWVIEESRLLDLPVWEMKPMASGTEVCTVLGISAKGPHVGAILSRMMDWQMLHIDQLMPLYHKPSAAPAADSSAMVDVASASASSAASSAAAVSAAAPAPMSIAPSAAALAPVKEACFAWLKTQNLAVATPDKTKHKQ